jgi:hypothetical protein
VRAAVAHAPIGPPVIHLVLNGRDGDKHHSVDTHWDARVTATRSRALPRARALRAE